MKSAVRWACAVFFVCVSMGSCGAAASDVKQEGGRYALYILQNDNKQVPILLDTVTGKIWWYSEEQTVGSTIAGGIKPKFQGVTVEGLVYSQKDAADLDKQLELLQSSGFLSKDIKGFKEHVAGEFSYGLDVDKAQGIYEKLKNTIPVKKE